MKLTVVLLLGLACTPVHPRVSLERGVSLRGYRVFVVGPVTDATRYPFAYPVTDSLRQEIIARLQSHGLTVGGAPADTSGTMLVITSTLDAFTSASPPVALRLPGPDYGSTRCTLSAELTDYRTGRHIGDIIASERTDSGIRALSPFTLLMRCARSMADEIERQVRKQ